MSKIAYYVGFAVLLTGLIGWRKASVQPSARNAWEYHVTGGLAADSLSKLGADGWELVAVIPQYAKLEGGLVPQCPVTGCGVLNLMHRFESGLQTQQARMYFKRLR